MSRILESSHHASLRQGFALRAATAIVAAIAALALFGAAAEDAEAGTYNVRECFAGESYPGYAILDGSFTKGGPTGGSTYYGSNDCASGLWAGTGDCGFCGVASTDDYARWSLQAPSNTTISAFSAFAYSVVANGHQTGAYDGNAVPFYVGSSNNGVEVPIGYSGSTGKIQWQIFCPSPIGCAQSSAAFIGVRNTTTTLNDLSNPSVAGVGGTLASAGWKLPGSESVSFNASDSGGGVRSAAVEVNAIERNPQTYGCTVMPSGYAGVFSPCAGSASYSTSLNTGSSQFQNGHNMVRVCAKDYANLGGVPNQGCQSFTAKIDRQDPSATVSGTGWSAPNNTLTPGEKTVAVAATDGVPGGSAAQQSSGVQRIEFKAWRVSDDKTVSDIKTQTDSACATTKDSCALNATFNYDTSELASSDGASTPIKVEVKTYDYKGRTNTQTKDLTIVSPEGIVGEVSDDDQGHGRRAAARLRPRSRTAMSAIPTPAFGSSPIRATRRRHGSATGFATAARSTPAAGSTSRARASRPRLRASTRMAAAPASRPTSARSTRWGDSSISTNSASTPTRTPASRGSASSSTKGRPARTLTSARGSSCPSPRSGLHRW